MLWEVLEGLELGVGTNGYYRSLMTETLQDAQALVEGIDSL